MKSIDLHGLSHKDALIISENFIINESLHTPYSIKIITGNSHKLKKKITNLLDFHKFNYYIPSHNLGEIIIKG